MSHHLDANFLKKHIKTGSTEDGACLTRHEKRKENDSCSHMWQGYEKAVSDSGVYNNKCGPLINKKYKSGARPGKIIPIFPKGLKIDEDGPVDQTAWNIPKGNNFKSWVVPYWNNAHHVIPNGVLSSVIAKAGGDDRRLVLSYVRVCSARSTTSTTKST